MPSTSHADELLEEHNDVGFCRQPKKCDLRILVASPYSVRDGYKIIV